MRPVQLLLAFLAANNATGQWAVWAEEFENGCASGCYATAYSTGANGAWTVVNTGTNGACQNRWFISCRENGNAVGACGTDCTSANESLHVGNEMIGVCASPNGCAFCPAGDCGAAYDAGCPAGFCAICTLLCGNCLNTQMDQRATSPVINLTGYSTLTLAFKYMEGGQGVLDNATLWYFDGAVWAQLADLPKTVVCASQGTWTNYAIALPASANNNANVRVGFRWVNNNDGTGADPSFAVDDVQITIPYAPTCNGLLVNELSNGPAGAQEYYELLVCGPSCTTLDIRNWKVDDNNGALLNGFGNSLVSSGTAAGHLRFSNALQWAAIPVGSLIVIHNNTDPNPLMPPDDPTDTAPADSVYILPANHALLEGCGTLPNPASTSNYNSGCAFGAGNFNYISLRNTGDAGQTRLPNGQYYHGISYGSNANNMNTGGIDLLRISAIDHTGRVLFFNNGNPRLAASYTSAVVAGNETPGAPNNAANATYINALLCNSLPITLIRFTARAFPDLVRAEWATATEHNNAYFTVERSADGSAFDAIGTVDGAGNALDTRFYSFDDPEPLPGLSYYRLRQTDDDGASALGPQVAVTYDSGPGGAHLRPDGTGAWILSGVPGATAWTLLDATGRTLEQGSLSGLPEERIAIRHGAAGWNILLVRSAERVEALRSPVGL